MQQKLQTPTTSSTQRIRLEALRRETRHQAQRKRATNVDPTERARQVAALAEIFEEVR